jgi:hypothetical protein
MNKTPEQLERDRSRVIALAEVLGSIQVEAKRKQQEKMLQDLLGKAPLKAVDKWIARQDDPALDRPEAIRRLVELGLKAKGK